MPCRYLLASGAPHRFSNGHRPHAYRRYAHEKGDDFFFVLREAVGVELFADGRVFGFLFFVLVENPFQRGTVASR